MQVTPDDIIKFWKDAGTEKWFKRDEDFDQQIRSKFGEALSLAEQGKIDAWSDTAEGCLALILVLDQFSRNLYRDSPKAFANDEKATALARHGLASDYASRVDQEIAYFMFMPLMHSESIVDQHQSVALQHQYGGPGNLRAAREHLEIIRRFGRFPHRNRVLQRNTTPEERNYLDAGGFSG